MRRPLALLLLVLLAAAPAAAQEKHGRMRVIRPTSPAGLRPAPAPGGLVGRPATTIATPLAPAQPLATPISTPALPFTPQAGDPSQCRLACAQSYYFCLAGDDAESCAPSWGQCRAACTGPPLAPPLASTVR